MSALNLPKILLVDDEKDNLDALRRLLRQDFQVFCASSGQEGLQLLAQHPDLEALVSDQRMPQMTGAQFFEQAQVLAPLPTRILLTGFADMEAVVEAVNLGHIWRYVAKPWEPEELKITLRQAAERTRLSRSLELSRRELSRALSELRAKEWARERLLQVLLHEFRTAPQILQSLKAMDGPQEGPVRERFVDNLQKRFKAMENDICSLLEEEKAWAKLARGPVRLSEVLAEIAADTQVPFANKVAGQDEAPILASAPELKSALRHMVDLLLKNNQRAPASMSLEDGGGHPAKSLFFSVQCSGAGALLPLGLSQQKLEPKVAWPALLEPFVGVEDFLQHTEGLRVETAKWVRLLTSWGGRPEFQVSGNAHQVELLLVFKTLES